MDQTIEQTLNRNTKTKSGIIGFSLKKGAVARRMLTTNARESFVDLCREMASLQEDDKAHKEFGSVQLKRVEEDVKKVMEIVSNWMNHFEKSEELVSLSSQSVASDSLNEDVLKPKEKVKAALQSFVRERLTSNQKGIFETLPKLKLGRFG